MDYCIETSLAAAEKPRIAPNYTGNVAIYNSPKKSAKVTLQASYLSLTSTWPHLNSNVGLEEEEY